MHHGQEIYTFFYRYGITGIYGIIFSSILIGLIIYKTLKISKKYNVSSYDELLNNAVHNKIINKMIKGIINVFLLTSFFVMVAGISAFFNQQFNINKIFSATVFCMVCYSIFNKNVERIIKINAILVPIIIIIFLILGVRNIENIDGKKLIEENGLWLMSSVLYMSYNTITLIGLIGVMHNYLKDKKECLYVSIITSIIIFALLLIIYFLLINMDKNTEIPMLYVSYLFGGIYKYLYSLTIFMAIFTTAISEGYTFLQNISKNNKNKLKIINLLICTAAIPVSLFGFSSLINTIYPLFGIIGLIQIFFILIK